MKNIFFSLVAVALISSNALASSFEDSFKSDAAALLLMKDLGLSSSSFPTEVRRESVVENGVEYVEITLRQNQLGDFKLLMKGPAGFSRMTNSEVSNCLFLASGFFTGRDSVRLLGNTPNTVLVGFQYSVSPEDIQRQPGQVLELIRKTPGQIAASLQWISRQEWLAPNGLVAMGVSLGGLFLPSSLHIAQQMDVYVPRTIFAFTGAHVGPVVSEGLKEYLPEDVVRNITNGIVNLTTLHDPKLHLPKLRGSFLIIHAEQDQVFPLESREKLENSILARKKIASIPGPHITPDNGEMIRQTQAIILKWLTTGQTR